MFAHSRHLCGWLAACALVAPFLGAQSVAPRISSEIAKSEQVTLAGSLHPMAQAKFDAGRVPSSTKLTGVSIVFSRTEEQEADLQALIAAQQDPSSPLYHQWLTPDQFAARFGMADADLSKVKSWLQQQGFSVDSVARSHNAIRFSGTARQVEQAFSTQMHSYKVSGVQHFAPSTELSLPSALSSVVLAVRNLDDFRPKPMHIAQGRREYTSSQSGNVHFAPGDIKVAYDIPSTYNGAGQSIAVMGQSAIVLSDIENFQSAASLSTKDPTLVLVPGSGTSTVVSGDESESDIDLEWAGGIATGANIIFVYTGSNTSYGVFDSIAYAVDEDIAPIISVSYGGCEAENSSIITEMETILAQAVTQGQTIIASSGDSGSTACYGDYGNTQDTAPVASDEVVAVNYPASSAYVTAMGGTEITSANDASGSTYWATSGSNPTTALQWIPEVAWNDDSASSGATYGWADALSSTGGGVSTVITRPTWQTGTIGGNTIPSGSYRLVPDISLYSSPNYPGYLYCSSDTETGIDGSCASGFRDADNKYLTVAGGTSFAAPVFAGMMAILNEAKGYTEGQGLINKELYTLAATSSTYSSAFHDVTAGTSSGTSGVGNECLAGTSYCSTTGTSEYPSTTGYDEATGLGSVDLANLIAAWPEETGSSASLTGTTTTITAATSAPAAGASDTFTITVVAASGSVTPTGNVTLAIDGGTTAYSNGGSTTTVALTASSIAGTATATYATSFSSTGTHQIIAQYAGSTAFAVSSGAVQVTVAGSSSGSGTGSFTISASPSTLTVKQGSTGTETLTLAPSGGYTGTVLMSYDTSNDSALTNLCVSADVVSSGYASVTVSGTSAVQANIYLDTSAADCAAVSSSGGKSLHRLGRVKAARSNSPSPAPLGVAFAGLLLAGFLGRYSRKFHTMAGVIALLALGLAVSACGGSSSTSTTTSSSDPPKGTYTITVVGEDSATSTITGSTTFTFVID
jgi:subtilase family serine protease